MENNNETFKYSYSAKQQEEIKRIYQKYQPKVAEKEDALSRIQRLDAETTKKSTAVSLIVGIISTLIMGTGMSCVMVGGNEMFFPGIIIGLIGLVGIAAAYPIYTRITKAQREKAAPEILRLTEELMNEQK